MESRKMVLMKLFARQQSRHREKVMATHSNTLAWKIPWTGEPGGLQSIRSLGVGHPHCLRTLAQTREVLSTDEQLLRNLKGAKMTASYMDSHGRRILIIYKYSISMHILSTCWV